MRFHADGPVIPELLLTRCDAGRVVFLCGAGVSRPSGMPNFIGLTQHVIEFFDPPEDSEIMVAFRPWLEDHSAANVPLDQIFNLLHEEYGRDEVNSLVTERLGVAPAGEEAGRAHGLIKRISSSQSGVPQIVTTNFDRLFELGSASTKLPFYEPPAFPDLNYGSTIEGITYLHGRLVEPTSEHHHYVLSSADFGRAYLSEGWATRFIRNLLGRYTVVLVGYQAEDPPVKYLLQGLNHDGQHNRSRLYSFDRGLPEDIEAKWRDRGVTAIAYADHGDLWRTMEAWAERADEPRRWRGSVIQRSQQDPKDMAPHERGHVAHVLRTVQGARSFSEADPAPHPEWLCVMDGNVRSAKQSSDYGDDAEVFEPALAYGLDDDDRSQDVNNDNLLVWREGDDNPTELHSLGGRQPEGYEATPTRLGHLITWISKSINSPVVAWWAIRKNGLHPRLIQQIEWQLEHSKDLSERCRHIWRLILEHHRDPRNRSWDGGWFDLKERIEADGWTASILRQFEQVATPRLEIKIPLGLGQSKPPAMPWDKIRLGEIGQFEVKFLERHNGELEVPDEMLAQVFSVLEGQLAIASGLLGDIETSYFQTPTCYPGREVDGSIHVTNAAGVMPWFIHLFDRMVDLWPELANAHAATWPATDQYYFRKLKLYALSKEGAFDPDYVATAVLSFDQESFWDFRVVRELLFLLVDRWPDFTPESRNRLTDRILAGPDQLSHWSDEEFPGIRDELAARYARYLELQGCDLTMDRSKRLAEMIGSIPRWRNGWASSIVVERGVHTFSVETDESPDALLEIPVSEVVAKAKEDLPRDFSSHTEKRSFTGLVKANPRKALAALTVARRAGDYPQAFWSAMIKELPDDITPRLRRVFLHRLLRLPHPIIAELRHTLGQWLKQNLVAVLEFDDDLGWVVYDHVVEGILSGGASCTESGLGQVRYGGELIERSRRTYEHAINSPIGMCAEALLDAVTGEDQEADSLIPKHIRSRIERLFGAPGEGSDHAVSIVTRQLNWFMYIDPQWTKERLIPLLRLEHPASEPAWNGFLHGQRPPSSRLADAVKPLLLALFPGVENYVWDRDLSRVAAQWLGWMRVFSPDQPIGLTRKEMRSVLRRMSDDVRSHFIFWLGRVGQENEDGWAKHVAPLVNDDWPRERRYRTSTSVRAWIELLDDTGDSFPIMYEAVKKFLAPVEPNDHLYHCFGRAEDDEKPLAVTFPEAVLDLMNRITPEAVTRGPYDLPRILALVAEADPRLTSDPRYLRLINLVERS